MFKMIGRKIVILVLMCMFLLASFMPLSLSEIKTDNVAEPQGAFLSQHNPILIVVNDDFTAKNGVIGGDGTADNPYIIANWNIKMRIIDILKDTDGMSIKDTTAFFVIKNCYIHFIDGMLSHVISKKLHSYGSNGINLYNVSNGKIESCRIKGMAGSINLENFSNNNLVINCKCWRNCCGIGINRFSNNNTVEGCETHNYGCSICLWDNVSYNIVKNCTCRKVPIRIFNSSYNQVSGCNITHCLEGIDIFNNSYDNTITGCKFYCNKLGLKIYDDSNNNLIYQNDFIKNRKQVYDECINQWDNGTHGNYWSNFKDVDGNGDGIWDHPISIPGGDNKDRYPLVNPFRI